MAKITIASLSILLLLRYTTAFNLYPTVDPNDLARAYGVTVDCLTALNSTVQCDQTYFQMAGTVDNYYWSDDMIYDLCTADCTSSTADWDAEVAGACWNQSINVNGKLVDVASITGRSLDGLNVACLYSPVQDEMCLLASQTWVGSDVVQPLCPNNSTDPTCTGTYNVTAADQRMASLYSDDMLCSDCFVQMLYLRVTSPYLPDVDHSDYLVDQLQDIQDVCSTTLPAITVRAIQSYPSAAAATPITFGNATTTSSIAPSATCGGQLITSGSYGASGCDTLSKKYNVATGDLQALTGSDSCAFTGSVCVPAACVLEQLTQSISCDSIASSISTVANNVTTLQLLTWNLNIIGLCDSLAIPQYICVSPPGGAYQLAPPPLGNDTNANSQQRGGATATIAPSGTAVPIMSVTSSAPPGSTQSGIIASCNSFAMASTGDTCTDFASANGITLAQLTAWNPVLGVNGADCSTNFWAGEEYCVGISANTTTSKSTSISTSTSSTTGNSTSSTAVSSAPGPTQSGIISTCDKYAKAASGDSCIQFATDNNITTAQLYTWNPVLGANGANCSTNFWAGEDYCVGVSTTTTTSTSTAVAPSTTKSSSALSTTSSTTTSTATASAPGPTQSGITPSCTSYAQAVSGDTCSAFAQRNNISTTELYDWNSVLGVNGANCSTSLWAGESYCVGIDA